MKNEKPKTARTNNAIFRYKKNKNENVEYYQFIMKTCSESHFKQQYPCRAVYSGIFEKKKN